MVSGVRLGAEHPTLADVRLVPPPFSPGIGFIGFGLSIYRTRLMQLRADDFL
jgi:hypothetical protein